MNTFIKALSEAAEKLLYSISPPVVPQMLKMKQATTVACVKKTLREQKLVTACIYDMW